MKRIVISMMIALFSSAVWGADGDTFTTYVDIKKSSAWIISVEMNFKIISESAKTCQLGDDTNRAIPYYVDLTQLALPEKANGYTIIKIGNNAFSGGGLYDITKVTIPSTVTCIGESAFYLCTELESIVIPNSVVEIGKEAFRYCSKLSSLTIPSSVTKIGEGAFQNCTSITAINIPDKITTLESGLFAYCKSLVSITIPSRVKTIGTGAFSNCKSLVSLSIPGNVKTIGINAFGDCTSLSSVSISKGVTAIQDYAFNGCSNLTKVTIDIKTPLTITSSTFSNRANAILYVPYGSKTAYETANNWKDFKTVEFMEYSDGQTFEENYSFAKFIFKIISESDKTCELAAAYCDEDDVDVIVPSTIYGYKVIGIGKYAFDDEDDMESVAIPPTITYIGEGAFDEGGWVDDVYISDLEAWCNITFADMDSAPTGNLWLNGIIIRDLVIPNNITTINNYAFYGCSIQSVYIHDGVESIGKSAFTSYLSSVTVCATNPISIDASSFTHRANATLYVPKGCVETYRAANYWKDFKEIVEMPAPSPSIVFADANVKALCVANWDTDNDGELSEAEAAAVTDLGSVFKQNTTITSFDELRYFTGLTTIGSYAFSYCSSLISIVIPSSVKNICHGAFLACNNLAVININSTNLSSIEGVAFQGCSKLRTVNLNSIANWLNCSLEDYYSSPFCNGAALYVANVEMTTLSIPMTATTIPALAFAGCENITSIIIPQSVNSIGTGAFTNCKGLGTINIPNNITSIGSSVFSGCEGLTSISLSSNLSTISSYAFSGCSNLASIVIPTGITSIDNNAFQGCTKMSSISIPNTVTDIGTFAFSECSSLESVTIPDNVKIISNRMFEKCYALTSVELPNSLTKIDDYAFSQCSYLSSIEIPENVEYIGTYAFLACYALKDIIIPEKVNKIEYGTFSNSGLESVTIPSSITSIGSWSFNCSLLTSVTIKATNPISIDTSVFSNRTNATLYVPYGSKTAYSSAAYWQDFNIVEIESNEPEEIEVTDISQMDNVIYIEPTEERTGTEATISFKMKNTAAIRGFQFDLELPEGVMPVEEDGEYVYWLNADRAPKKAGGQFYHTLEVTKQINGSYRFLCGAQQNKTFSGNNGEVAVLKVNIADDMQEGDYPITLKNVKLSETDISNYYQTDEVVAKLTIVNYIPGDISNDGIVDVSDYIGVANHILGNTPAGFNARAADVNNDNVIDVSDYIGIANIILTGSIYGNNNAAARLVEKNEEQNPQ